MRTETTSAPTRRSLRTRRPRRRSVALSAAAALTLGVFAVGALTAAAPAQTAQALTPTESATPTLAVELVSYTTPSPAESSTDATTAAVASVTAEARTALDDAEEIVGSIDTIAEDIEKSEIEVSDEHTDIDTAELEQTMDRLADVHEVVPAPLVPYLIDELSEHTDTVDEKVSTLKTEVKKAKEKKAAEEAAEKARKEAEAAAAAAEAERLAAEQAAAQQQSNSNSNSNSSPAPAPAPVTAAAGTSAGEAQAIARSMLGSYGWGDDQFGCLVNLWNKESGWNVYAQNPYSGAYGIPQALPGNKMATAGGDWQTNAATQIRWGMGYIQGRYGSPCGAWGHSQAHNWY